MTESLLEPFRADALGSLLSDLPKGYAERYKLIEAIRHAFYFELASALETPLNQYLATCPQDSAEERRELAATVNLQLRQVGLSIRSPFTQEPSRLVVDTQNADHPEITRYRYGSRGPTGRARNHGCLRELPLLELMEAAPRVESFSAAFQKTCKDGPVR
jgi:hypothetical protein